MIAAMRDCLSNDEMMSLLSGRLDGERFAAAIDHLDDCQDCQHTIDRIDANADRLFPSDDDRDPKVDTACQVAIDRLLVDPPRTPAPRVELPSESAQFGPYKVLESIGHGGMGLVYLAEHQRLKRQCAIKFLPRQRVEQPGWLDRFDREMTAIAGLEHPHIVHATDAGHDNGWHYLVMEYLDGLDLGRIAGRLGRIGIADACEIIRQAALGLAQVHRQGLVHRDIKPSNLMLTRDGVVKLLDLGLVLSGDDPLTLSDRLTTVGHLLGTMPYMAPEQLLDSRQVDPSADIYALGATLYRLIAGRAPHSSERGLGSQVLAITRERPASLATFDDRIEASLSSFIDRMLDHDPANRPTADEVAGELTEPGKSAKLQQLVRRAEKESDSPEPSIASLPPVPESSPPRKRRWTKYLAAGFMAAGIALAGVIFKIQTERGELVVESEADDVTLRVEQQDQLVERLQIERGDDNRLTLRQGTYEVHIDGGEHEYRLSKNRIVIEGADQIPVQISRAPDKRASAPNQTDVVETSSSNQRVYQGKTLSRWLDILHREQDPQARGEAIRAVEVLSRGTDRRMEAAKETMRFARRLGGVMTGGGDESSQFMESLQAVFPRYFPEPGLTVVAQELESGTRESRLAASRMLTKFLTGVVGRVGTKQRNQRARDHLREMAGGSPEERERLESIIGNLGKLANSLQADDDESQLPKYESRIAREEAFRNAADLAMIADRKLDSAQWLSEYVEDRLEEVKKTLARGADDPSSSSGPVNPNPPWLLSSEIFEAAMELRREGRLDFPAHVVAPSVVHPRFYVADDDRKASALRRVAEMSDAAVEDLRKQLRERVKSIVDLAAVEDSSTDSLGSGGDVRMGGSPPPDPTETMRFQPSFWKVAYEMLADDVQTADQSLRVLTELRDTRFYGETIVPKELVEPLDEAIETLRQRVNG